MQGFFRGRPRLITAVLAICALGALALPSASAAPARTSAPAAHSTSASAAMAISSRAGTLTSRVHGTFGRNGVVRGHFKPVRFIVRHGDPYAYGVLHAKLIRGNGHVVGHVSKRVTIPLNRGASSTAGMAGAGSANSPATAAASCDILNLVLGPLDLNLLGLHVHLNKVVLHINAIPGAGNLLGNLLCAVAGLLDNTGLLNTLQLSNLLNRILGILRIV
jgi:hypothetical protein